MKHIHYYIGAFLALCLAVPAIAQSPVETPDAASEFVEALFSSTPVVAQAAPGEYLVQYKNQAKSANQTVPFEVVQRAGQAEEVLEALRKNPDVAYAEPNYLAYAAAMTPNDTEYSSQWHWYNTDDNDVDANQAWSYGRGDSDIVIAVIDSGIDTDHPDLDSKIWVNPVDSTVDGSDQDGNGYKDDNKGWDWVDDDRNPNPRPDGGNDDGVPHGTHVAGLIGAETDNNQGVAGMSWESKLMALRVLNDQGVGTVGDIASAIYYAIDKDVDVINLSLGLYTDSSTLKNAINAAEAADIVVVGAAGNYGDNLNIKPFYPACYSTVIGVAATDRSDEKASYTNYGSNCVSLSAPGTNVLSTFYTDNPTYGFTDDYSYLSGTSQSTAIVSGIAANAKARDLALTASQIRSKIINNTDNVGLGTSMGTGRANARKVMESISTEIFPPDDVVSANRDAKIRTTWTKDGKAYYFKVYRKEVDVDADFVKISTSRVYDPYYDDVNVEVGHTYRYKVMAVDANGRESGLSAYGGSVTHRPLPRVVAAPGSGRSPEVRIINPISKKVEYSWLAYGSSFQGGVEIAVGDVDGDGKDEIVTGAGQGGGPQVNVFDKYGNLQASFFAYDAGFRGGVRVATGDINADGIEEIITVPGPGMGPLVKTWKGNGSEAYPSFFALDGKFQGGAFVEAVNFDGKTREDIAVSAGPGGGAQVTVHRARDGMIKGNFFAYDQNTFRGGIRVSSADTDNEGADELFTIPAIGHTHVQFFGREPGFVRRLNPGFYAWPTTFGGGGYVAGGDTEQDTEAEIIVGSGPGIQNRIRIYSKGGDVKHEDFSPFESSFSGGVAVSSGYF